MTPLEAIALIWTWHLIWMSLLTLAIAQAAYRHSGWPVHRVKLCRSLGECRFRVIVWPVSGRWLLVLLFLSWALITADITKFFWELVASDLSSARSGVTWRQVAFRAPPVIIGPWVFWRQWRRGLASD